VAVRSHARAEGHDRSPSQSRYDARKRDGRGKWSPRSLARDEGAGRIVRCCLVTGSCDEPNTMVRVELDWNALMREHPVDRGRA